MSHPDPLILNEIQIGQPAWRMALLFPPQGSWTEQEYLALDAGRQIEFERGCVEVLDLPTKEHQRMVRFLFRLMDAFVTNRRLGEVFFAPLPVRLWSEKYREPDLIFIKRGRDDIGKYPHGADLVIEIVNDSPSDRKRDLETKVGEYEMAGIQEYWVVDPQKTILLMHQLVESKYVVEKFTPGQTAHSNVSGTLGVGSKGSRRGAWVDSIAGAVDGYCRAEPPELQDESLPELETLLKELNRKFRGRN